MQKRTLGSSGLEVSAIGLGCMTMTGGYSGMPERQDMITLLRRAVDLGATFFDTAEAHGPHANEELVGEALAPYAHQVVIATKFAQDTDPVERKPRGPDAAPRGHRRSCRRTPAAARAGRDRPLLPAPGQPRRADRGNGRRGQGFGRRRQVKHFGMSKAAADTIRRAHAVQPVTAIQSEYTLWWRRPEQVSSRPVPSSASGSSRSVRSARASSPAPSPPTTSGRRFRGSPAQRWSTTSRWSTRSTRSRAPRASAGPPLAVCMAWSARVRQVPRGRLRLVTGRSPLAALFPDDDTFDEVEEFLEGTRSGGKSDRAVYTVLFTDLAGPTEHVTRVGDDH
jgi:Aldo/keto reductase family